MSGSEVQFDKYAKKGAYHWREVEGSLGALNAYTMGRYDLAVDSLRAAGFPPGGSLIDIGCGDGALTGLVHRRLGANVLGIDPSGDAVELARRSFRERGWQGRFEVADAYSTGFAEASFDAAVSADVIEHVQHPDRLLKEARRIVKPGGILVVTTPLRVSEAPFDPLHVNEWFGGEFAELCAANFGRIEAQRFTHPAVWFEVYRAAGGRWGRFVKLAMNFAASRGHNLFLRNSPAWSIYTQQAVTLRRE